MLRIYLLALLLLYTVVVRVHAAAPTPAQKPVINKSEKVAAALEANRQNNLAVRNRLAQTYCVMQPYGSQTYMFCYYKDDLEVVPLKPNKI